MPERDISAMLSASLASSSLKARASSSDPINRPCWTATAIAASIPLSEVPIMPTRQGGMLASMRPDHGLGNQVRVDSSSSGQTCPVAITARSKASATGSSSTHSLTPSSVACRSLTRQDSLTRMRKPCSLASPTSARNWSRKYSPSRMRGKN